MILKYPISTCFGACDRKLAPADKWIRFKIDLVNFSNPTEPGAICTGSGVPKPTRDLPARVLPPCAQTEVHSRSRLSRFHARGKLQPSDLWFWVPMIFNWVIEDGHLATPPFIDCELQGGLKIISLKLALSKPYRLGYLTCHVLLPIWPTQFDQTQTSHVA